MAGAIVQIGEQNRAVELNYPSILDEGGEWTGCYLTEADCRYRYEVAHLALT